MERKLEFHFTQNIQRKKRYGLYFRSGTTRFSRIFTCLLSVNRPKEEIVAEFKEIINHAKITIWKLF